MPIQSFADQAAEDFWNGVSTAKSRKLAALGTVGHRKLDMLHFAVQLTDLLVPPGNRLEALRGDLAGLHSIRINDQWRIVFRWTNAGPAEVRIVDYH